MKTKLGTFLKSFTFSFSMSWKASKAMTIIRMICIVVEAVIPTVLVWIGKLIVDLITEGISKNTFDANLKLLIIDLSALLLICVFSIFLRKIRESIESMHIDLINYEIEMGIMNKAAILDLSYFDNPKLYNDISNVMRERFFLQKLIWNTTSLVYAIIGLISSMILLMGLHPLCALIVVVLCLPDAIIDKRLRGSIYNKTNEITVDERRFKYLYKIFFDKYHCKEIRLYALKDFLIEKYIVIRDDWRSRRIKLVKKRSEVRICTSVISRIGFIAIQIFIGIKVILGVITLGNYTLYTGLFSNALNSMDSLITAILGIYDADLRVGRHLKFMSLKENVYPCGTKEIKGCPTIEFKNVSFKYPLTDYYVLEDVSFVIRPGEKIAIVGLNGAGKTTITKLMMRFYEPTSGQILIDGLDIHEYSDSSIKKLYSPVFQDFSEFSFSAKETIGMSNIDCINDEERLREACKKSGASEFIEQWEKGYETSLTKRFDEDGEELSGGQWQKIAIASAFFRDSEVMVLDEPTANLDPKAEYEMLEQFTTMIENKSAIIISHRLSSVVMMDKILVLSDHKIIEEGSHQALLDLNGVYAELFNLQAQKYVNN